MAARVVRLLFCGEPPARARGLRDAGHEVVLVGAANTAEQLAAVAVQEDVGLVAVTDAELGATVADRLGDAVVVFWVTSASPPS